MFLHYYGYLEAGVDTLTVIDSYKTRKDLTQSADWIVDGNVTLEFKSDGSIVEGGFSVETRNLC